MAITLIDEWQGGAEEFYGQMNASPMPLIKSFKASKAWARDYA
jgi:hypothetical protein